MQNADYALVTEEHDGGGRRGSSMKETKYLAKAIGVPEGLGGVIFVAISMALLAQARALAARAGQDTGAWPRVCGRSDGDGEVVHVSTYSSRVKLARLITNRDRPSQDPRCLAKVLRCIS